MEARLRSHSEIDVLKMKSSLSGRARGVSVSVSV